MTEYLYFLEWSTEANEASHQAGPMSLAQARTWSTPKGARALVFIRSPYASEQRVGGKSSALSVPDALAILSTAAPMFGPQGAPRLRPRCHGHWGPCEVQGEATHVLTFMGGVWRFSCAACLPYGIGAHVETLAEWEARGEPAR